MIRPSETSYLVGCTQGRNPRDYQAGDPFNVTVELLAGIPFQYAMLFGIERYDEEWSVEPRPGSLGPVLLSSIDPQKTLFLLESITEPFLGYCGPDIVVALSETLNLILFRSAES
ncbi:hypothetical protein GGS23DRAFT_594135 [Durotheca rogersii]|uniref:uncharacterized protein n=1 Tax=Durotheca rogersii TaxID=419775 RepID=UPI00221EE0FA|nr:uncharacterized protein GGS23DRAFT_594135 [Durotheca rogersii]KAI5865979.1 hypothetical protein GGS23DRAFT_594135 [Durotheca rogersii]